MELETFPTATDSIGSCEITRKCKNCKHFTKVWPDAYPSALGVCKPLEEANDIESEMGGRIEYMTFTENDCEFVSDDSHVASMMKYGFDWNGIGKR